MKVALLLFVSLCFAVGCTKRNPNVCCTTQADCDAIGLPLGTDCDDGLTCLGNLCVAATTCQADSDCPSSQPRCGAEGVCVECIETSECGDRVCDSTGSCVACTTNDECTDGFCTEGVCRTSIIPKYLPDVCDSAAPTDVTLDDFGGALDTSDDLACNEIVVQGGGAPEICVIRANNIVLTANTGVAVTGSRALALVADLSLRLEGALVAAGRGVVPGPGAAMVVSGDLAINGVNFDRGGGGAGSKSNGGDGGTLLMGGANNGGVAQPNPSSLVVFSGGTSNSGGGGGAVTLISCRGAVSVSGIIDVGGGGGSGGVADGVRAGGGGGSGGYVVFQGVRVEVTGQIFANGGAGGGGSFDPTQGASTNGKAGQNGSLSATTGAKCSGCNGGDGAFSVAPPGDGGPQSTVAGVGSGAPGGGGGSVGFLQIYTPIDVAPLVSSATTSPAFEEHLPIATQ